MNHPQQLASERTDIKFCCKFYVFRGDIYFFFIYTKMCSSVLVLLTRAGAILTTLSGDEVSSFSCPRGIAVIAREFTHKLVYLRS